MKRHAVRIFIGLGLTILFLIEALGIFGADRPTNRLEARLYDLRLNLAKPGGVDPRIVIVNIDEKSLSEEGRWPWSRDRIALLIDSLFDRYNAAVVGFDVVFAEKDTSSGVKVLESLAKGELKDDSRYCKLMPQLKKQLDYDSRFAHRLKQRPVVLGYIFTGSDRKEVRTSGQLPPPALTAETFKGRKIPFVSMAGYGANLPELQQCAAGAGHFNPYIDPDGEVRRLPVLVKYGGDYYEALSVAVVRTLFGNPPLTPVFSESGGGIEKLRISDMEIPVDNKACALIPYRGGQGSFRYISASDIIRGRIPREQLEGSIFLVGATALGLMELRSTPVSEVFPGVEVHANMIAGILDQSFLQSSVYTRGGERLVIIAAGLLLSLALPFLAPLWSTLLALGCLAAVIGINAAAWHYHLVLPLAASLLLISLLYIFNMTYGFFAEARARHRLAGLFGQYIPPELVKEMSARHQEFTMEGESREMTVLFSDVRNFTTLSEGMEPKELTRMMNEYLTPMTQVIHRHRGTIDKYIGDAIMAFWGAPLADEDHARNAAEAALDMKTAMDELRARFKEHGWPEFHIGVGLNTGIMNVGNMGSQFRRAYTVMGDSVNLGSRLEGLTKYYGVGVLISEATRARVPGVICRELDCVQVKGKEEPVAIFEPLGREGEVDSLVLEEAALFAEGLRLYRERKWNDAETVLAGLLERSPNSVLYKLYLERIAHFRLDPPGEGWDGVFRFRVK